MADIATIQNKLNDAVSTQKVRYQMPLSVSGPVPCKGNTDGNTARLKVTNNLDGYFIIDEIRIKVYGPTDINGVVPQTIAGVGSAQTDFPSGLTVSSAANATQKAEDGLSVKITDQSTQRVLGDGFLPVACAFAPGYGEALKVLPAWKHVLGHQKDLYFEFRNRDNAKLTDGANAYHYVEVVLIGERYEGLAPSVGA